MNVCDNERCHGSTYSLSFEVHAYIYASQSNAQANDAQIGHIHSMHLGQLFFG
jgi:hypothetical protein